MSMAKRSRLRCARRLAGGRRAGMVNNFLFESFTSNTDW